MVGNVIEEDFRSTSGTYAASGEYVFQCIGDSVQRTPVEASRQFFIGAARLLFGELVRNRYEGIEFGLQLPDSPQRRAHQFEGRYFPRAQFSSSLSNGHWPRTALSESVIAGSMSGDSFTGRGRKACSRAESAAAISFRALSGTSRPRAFARAFQSVITQYYKPEWPIFSSFMEHCAASSITIGRV